MNALLSRAAKDLGIPEEDLYYALKLVRELRTRAIMGKVDPRATRIALIYANLVDRHEARKKLSTEEMNRLSEIAVELFNETKVKTPA